MAFLPESLPSGPPATRTTCTGLSQPVQPVEAGAWKTGPKKRRWAKYKFSLRKKLGKNIWYLFDLIPPIYHRIDMWHSKNVPSTLTSVFIINKLPEKLLLWFWILGGILEESLSSHKAELALLETLPQTTPLTQTCTFRNYLELFALDTISSSYLVVIRIFAYWHLNMNCLLWSYQE